MWEYIPERVKKEAEYILQTGATVRVCAAHFDVSKSTVHKDVTERLKDIDNSLWEGVRKVLDKNLSERHIRGGIATKNKYLLTENQGKNNKNINSTAKARCCSADCCVINSDIPCHSGHVCNDDTCLNKSECTNCKTCNACVKRDFQHIH